jgi:putative hydrolase of the HAD superfamily
MTAGFNWDAARLVVFDVDGTLYDQRAMRLRMMREVVGNAIWSRCLTNLRVLRTYRQYHETIGDQEIDGFADALVVRTAEATDEEVQTVRAIVAEWIEVRPLAHIRACRYPHVDKLFAALHRQSKKIGIFSDYPAIEKLCAMELAADHVVSAGDEDVGILKPHPRGLELLMERAGVSPDETIMIGDRIERDGEAARRAGVTALIRSNRSLEGWLSFSRFSDPLFAPLLGQ